MRSELSPDWDAIVIGSGLGGTMAAHELVRSGLRVLMLERERGALRLVTGQVVTRVRHDGSRVTAVEAIDLLSGRTRRVSVETVVLAAGPVASPHLILASGLEQLNPAGDLARTLRMGADVRTSVLDPTGRFRGLENLYVVDASNALCVGAHIVELH